MPASSAAQRVPTINGAPFVEQTRRGRASVNSGWGERIVDLGVGSALVLGSARSLLQRHWLLGAAMALGGGYLLYAGATGHFSLYAQLSLVREGGKSQRGLVVQRSITILMPREQVYNYWRDVTHLPTFMSHLESVLAIDEKRSHWVARAPLGAHVEWDAEITEEQPNELIAWESLPNANVSNQGHVRFFDAPVGRGTQVEVRLVYEPPFGSAGAAVARLFGEEPTKQVDSDLRRLKALLETGEAPTTKHQPHGGVVIGNSQLLGPPPPDSQQ